MKDSSVIHTLNKFLQGRYMGIHQFEHLIHQAKDQPLKELLQQLQLDTKSQAARVAQRIQQLGGEAAHDVGITGRMQEWVQQWMKQPQTAEEILKDAFMGENKYGIHLSHEIVEGDLDPESAKLIDDILDEDHRHVDRIQAWLGGRVPATR